jgi:serine/threonine protein kinase
MKQTLRALAFMHSAKYMHKDLKPQNIMMVDRLSPSIKLIDFGLAELFEKDTTVSSVFGGTLLYIAPEGFGRGLEMKSDVWSAGVILYNLITGDYPFIEQWPLPAGKDMAWWQSGVRNAIETQRYRNHKNLTAFVSKDCVNLMDQMLDKDPRRRPDAAKCLEHKWFKSFDRKPPPLSVGVSQCLDAFAGQPELKKAVFLLIAHQSTVPALEELRAIFTHFDTSNRGTISAASIREVLNSAGMSHLRAAKILHALDRDQSGAVSWTEFIAAALCVSVCSKENLVAAAFAAIDQNNDGKAGVEDVKDVFAKGHESLWSTHLPAECKKINEDFDRSKCFTKEQFHNYMKGHMRLIAGDQVAAVAM